MYWATKQYLSKAPLKVNGPSWQLTPTASRTALTRAERSFILAMRYVQSRSMSGLARVGQGRTGRTRSNANLAVAWSRGELQALMETSRPTEVADTTSSLVSTSSRSQHRMIGMWECATCKPRRMDLRDPWEEKRPLGLMAPLAAGM